VTDLSKRSFLRELGRHLGKAVGEFRREAARSREEGQRRSFFDSYESSYALTLAYPQELIEDAARRAGIDPRGKDELQLLRELFQDQEL
jgi:Sec-independent protein translocase protein TatA